MTGYLGWQKLPKASAKSRTSRTSVIPLEPRADPQGNPDVVYRTEKGKKFEAVVNGILQEDNTLANEFRQYNERGQLFVGTISIEKLKLSLTYRSAPAFPIRRSTPSSMNANRASSRRWAARVPSSLRTRPARQSTFCSGRQSRSPHPRYFLKNKMAISYAAVPCCDWRRRFQLRCRSLWRR